MSRVFPLVVLGLLLSSCGGYRGTSDDGDTIITYGDNDIWIGGDSNATGDTNSAGDTNTTVCDYDHDGHSSTDCGGDDCDDNNAAIHPDFPELCDFWDNNCNGQLNDGIECTFYAHSPTTLFKVDPFRSEVSQVGDMQAHMWDIDTDPTTGTLFAVGSEGLFRYNDAYSDWVEVGDATGLEGNGFAIDNDGNAYVTNLNQIISVDLFTGEAVVLGDGSIGSDGDGDFVSSGDCVVNKDNTLYMTSKHTETDTLILINSETFEGEGVGLMGFDKIYALTAAWEKMFGLTVDGELLLINESTGEATLLSQLNESWYGAASTPLR